MPDALHELSSSETHRIGSWPWNRLEAESAGRGWRHVHASVATVNTWAGAMEPIGHPCIAYCVSQPAFLRRRLDGDAHEQMTLRPRQLFLIPADRRSEWDRRGRTEMLMVYLRQDLLDALADELGSLGRNGNSVRIELPLGTVDPFLEQFALEALSMLRAPEDGSSAMLMDTLARAAAVYLLRRYVPGRHLSTGGGSNRSAASNPALRRVAALIEASLGDNLSLDRLAREAGLPVNVFGRAFRETYGTSPHQYVLAKRLEHARALLIATDTPINAIAMDTGFSSQSHLTTAFKRYSGVAPAAFRRSVALTRSGSGRR